IYSEPDPGFFVGLGESQSGNYLFIHAHDHATSETRFIPATTPLEAPRLVAERTAGREYSVEDAGGETFIILTNADGAEDFKLMQAPIATPGYENWQTLVPHVPGRLI